MQQLGKIGKYELLKVIAVGGMAEVVLARQTGLQEFEKVVVIKRILPHLAVQERFINMFISEARLAARFNHPNIVQIYELGKHKGSFFMAMEYIHGEDLKSIVRRCAKLKRRLPVEHIVKIMSEVCNGLNYAHSQVGKDGKLLGVVHRDISPQNVLLSYQGGVKIVDFGIAKVRNQISTTIPGKVKGKHAYMSPEQCYGKKLDRRSDIFSAGIIMYELLTWRRLFKKKRDQDTIKAVVECKVKPPKEIVPELDDELQDIVLKALAAKPKDRYQTAQEMQLALEDYLVNNGLKSNSILLARFIEDLYADRIEARNKALVDAKVENLECAVLSKVEKNPYLVGFLDSYFDNSDASANKPKKGEKEAKVTEKKDVSNQLMDLLDMGSTKKPSQDDDISDDSQERSVDVLSDADIVSEEEYRREAEKDTPKKSYGLVVWLIVLGVIVALLVMFYGIGQESQTSVETGKTVSQKDIPVQTISNKTIYSGVVGRGQGKGVINVTSKPEGGLIYLDGVLTDKRTPHVFNGIEAGLDHVVLVEKPGMIPGYERITLADGQKAEVDFVLVEGKPNTSRIAVNFESEPDGASVIVNGYPMKKKTPLKIKLLAGKGSLVEISKDGYKAWTGTVRPIPKVDLALFAKLKKK
jgi:serine/threonine protein kinase